MGNFVRNGKMEMGYIANTVTNAVHFLNRVIDANVFPLDKLTEMNLRTRRIGIGVMGWADALGCFRN